MKKKICIFANYFPLFQGGAEYQSYLIAKSLDSKKFDIFFLSFNHSKQKIVNKDGYKIYSIRPNKYLLKFGNPFFLYYFSIKKILSQEKPDIVYRRMGAAMPGLLGLLKNRLNFKLIWACAHINNLKKYEMHRPKDILNFFDDFFRIYGIKKADTILVQTNDQRQLLLKNFKRHSLLFPNLHPTPNIEIKKKRPIKILWIANYKKWKQPEIFFNLVEKLQGYSNVKYIMIGRPCLDKHQKRMNKRINELKQLDHKGELPIEDVNRILAESHIFINTSLYEGFPNTFIQAWMRKIPVISLHVDPDDIIKNNNIGFHSKTYERLVEDTKTLIEDYKLREEMGERGYNFATKNFSLKNIDKLIDLFENE